MRHADQIGFVRSLPPFSSMAPETFERLAKPAYLQRFPKDVVLIEQGGAPDMLHVLVEGVVELYAEHDGQRTSITIHRPVTGFILAAVVRDLPYLMSARTLEPSRIVLIPAQTIQELLREDTAFAMAMIDELARGFRTMVKTVKSLKLRSVNQRIANYLLVLRQEADGADRVMLPLDKSLIASLLGMTRESFSRGLSVIRDNGATVRGREVIFTDLERLAAMAQPDPLIDDLDQAETGFRGTI